MAYNNQMQDSKSSNGKYRDLFKSAIEHYENRRQELDGRHRQLNNRVTIMEHSVPAIMAFNMYRASQGTSNQSGMEMLCEIMKKLTPESTDDLAADLAKRVEGLNRETAELHDKIIETDVELMETCMELESLELINREMMEQIKRMENRLDNRVSFEFINSEDRLALARMRQLGEDEVRLKRSIRELEAREAAMREQVTKILDDCIDESTIDNHKHHVHKSNKHGKNESTKINSAESVSDRNENGEEIECEKIIKTIEQEIPITCNSQTSKPKPIQKKTEKYEYHRYKNDCHHLQQKKKKILSNQLQNNNFSQKKLEKETQLSPNSCTTEITTIQNLSSEKK